MIPPTRQSTMASMRNCRRMLRAARADGHAQADLARAFGDGDEHDVHDSHAADDQRDGGDDQQQLADQLGGGGERVHHLGHVADLEIVGLAVAEVVALAEQLR